MVGQSKKMHISFSRAICASIRTIQGAEIASAKKKEGRHTSGHGTTPNFP